MKKITVSKSELIEYEQIFFALSHASRRHILVCLSQKSGPMLGGEIADLLECSWPTTTGHLQTLEKAGFLRLKKNGREKIYSINFDKFEVIQKWITMLRN